jgi:hypothetical protein
MYLPDRDEAEDMLRTGSAQRFTADEGLAEDDVDVEGSRQS